MKMYSKINVEQLIANTYRNRTEQLIIRRQYLKKNEFRRNPFFLRFSYFWVH